MKCGNAILYVTVSILLFCSLNTNAQAFIDSFKEVYGTEKFIEIRDELLQVESDSLKRLLREKPMKIYLRDFMSEYSGKPKNEDIFKYDILLVYLSGALLDHREEIDEIDYFNLAWTKEINSDYKEAIADYTKSLKGNFTETTFPARSVILGGRAKCKFAVEDYYGAINDFSSAIKDAPTTASYHIDRGRCYAITGKFEQAIRDFTTASEMKPEDYQSYYYRALVHLSTNQKESACLDFSRAGELGYEKAYEEILKYCQ